MPQEPPCLRYNLESLWGMSKRSLDRRVWSLKSLRATFGGGGGLGVIFGGSVGWGVRVEGARSSVGDCWKGLGIRSTPECLWNLEVVGVRRMPKVSEVGVGKTPRCFQSRKQVIPWHTGLPHYDLPKMEVYYKYNQINDKIFQLILNPSLLCQCPLLISIIGQWVSSCNNFPQWSIASAKLVTLQCFVKNWYTQESDAESGM